MNITIDVEAKRLVVRENGLPFILELLKDKDENVLLNAVKCITNCGEDYRGRFFAHSSLSKVGFRDGALARSTSLCLFEC